MATITTTQSFTTGDQVTAATLNAIATGSAFDTSVVDDSSTALTTNASGTANSRIIVKDGGVSTAKIADSAVTTAKLGLTDGATISKSGASEVIASFTTTQDGSNRGLFIQTPDSATDLDSPFILNTGNSISFEVDNTEAMRIDTGRNVLIGTTTVDGQGGASFRPNFDDGAARLTFNRANSTNNSVVLQFENNDTTVGQIFHNNSSTTFSTSSDYRLKEDIVEMKDSISRVQALKPVNFAWKVDGTRVDGFLAHEAQEVVPEAVIGNKDAVDEDGQPEYQGIDQSKLVPLLTKALQESLTKIESLEARVAALES
jgi:hypothetical protein